MKSSLKERQDALVRRHPQWVARTLHETLDHAAASFPDRPYVLTDELAWSYADVKSRSEKIAAGLVAAGVEPGDHVAMVLANHPDFVALKYAISRVGATAVPVNFLNRRDELGYVLKQSDAAFLVTMDRFRDLDYLAALDALMPGWEREGGGAAFPRLKRVVVFPTGNEPVRAGALDFAQLLSTGPSGADFPSVDPQSVSDIIYTSGTTGAPKGVMLTHDMLLRAAFGSAYCRGFDDGWRVTFALPMYHVYGYVEGLLTVPFVGGAIIPQLQFSPAGTLDAIDTHRADDVLLVPTMTTVILDELRARPRELPSLRAVISSGQRSAHGIFREIFDLMTPDEVTTGYGMTEVTATTMATRADDPHERLAATNGRMREIGPAGEPSLGGRLVDYRIVDPETGKVLAPGEVGELMAKGPGVTKGYYNKPEATAEAFDAEGWLHTGDLARFDADGYMTLVGRRKESYRCGGEQVMPTEIEDVLTAHPAVLQAHVVPVPDRRMGEAGAAYVVLRDGVPVAPDELIALCADRLARFKVPKYVLPIRAEDLPTTPSGRARKFLLTQRAIEELQLT
jgi:fatty-acyl-CoA synthase